MFEMSTNAMALFLGVLIAVTLFIELRNYSARSKRRHVHVMRGNSAAERHEIARTIEIEKKANNERLITGSATAYLVGSYVASSGDGGGMAAMGGIGCGGGGGDC